MGEGRGEGISAHMLPPSPTLSLKGEGTYSAQILRDIFFRLVTEEQKIGLLRLNIAEKKHGRNDREPIGRKGKPTRPVKQKVSRRRYEMARNDGRRL